MNVFVSFVRIVVPIATFVLVLVGCGSSARVTTIQALTADTSSGQSLYASKCASCHGTNGSGGSAGKNVTGVTKSDSTAAIDQILNGGDGMSSFSSLSDQNIADIVGYIKSL